MFSQITNLFPRKIHAVTAEGLLLKLFLFLLAFTINGGMTISQLELNVTGMILKVINGLLILLTTVMSIRHSWVGLTGNARSEDVKLLTGIGMGQPVQWGLNLLSVVAGLLVLFPRTFFVGNLLGALLFVVLNAYALHSGNVRAALGEVPFLLIPLALLWLGHPLTAITPTTGTRWLGLLL